jgi:hypothetical protein
MPERKIGQYGDRFNPTIRGLRPYEVKKTKHILLSLFWLTLLLLWISLTIFILINIQELPHPDPSSAPMRTGLCLSLWLSISFLILMMLLVNLSKLWVKNEHHKHSKIL